MHTLNGEKMRFLHKDTIQISLKTYVTFKGARSEFLFIYLFFIFEKEWSKLYYTQHTLFESE